MREKTNKACTISNIAEYAQVSRSTVSRVLNNVNTKVPVSAATRAKIAEAIRHFDYMPNANARRLSHNKSFIIGLQVPAHHLSRYVFTDYNLIGAMHGLEAALLPSDYKLLLLFQSEKYMQKHEYLSLLKSKSIDGLLIWGATCGDHYDAALADYPVIFLNSLPAGASGFEWICHDNHQGSLELVGRLIEAGARRFRYLSGPLSNSISLDRYCGFREALAQAQIPFDEERERWFGDFHRDSARALTAPFFETSGDLGFDAIVCSNDMMASGVYDAATAAGRQPGKDFQLAGGDGADDCAQYPLKTFRSDRFALGFRGINRMFELIDAAGPQEPRQEYLPVQVQL